MEIAQSIKMSHPSVINIINKMTSSGYIDSEKDTNDSRRRLLTLSEYAISKLPEYESIWDAGSKGVEKTLEAMEFITQLEDEFFERGFKERVLGKLDKIHLK